MNPETLMFNDPVLFTVNILLIGGIVLALLAAARIKKGTRELRTKNRATRRTLYRHNKS